MFELFIEIKGKNVRMDLISPHIGQTHFDIKWTRAHNGLKATCEIRLTSAMEIRLACHSMVRPLARESRHPLKPETASCDLQYIRKHQMQQVSRSIDASQCLFSKHD